MQRPIHAPLMDSQIGRRELENLRMLDKSRVERHLGFTVYSSSLHEQNAEGLSRLDITCFRCGEKGHKKSECRMWKTKFCRNHVCVPSEQCPFAHSQTEVRTPWMARCVRVIRSDNGQLQRIGCGKLGHTFRECPEIPSESMNTELRSALST